MSKVEVLASVVIVSIALVVSCLPWVAVSVGDWAGVGLEVSDEQ
jgi:hypothetical protein